MRLKYTIGMIAYIVMAFFVSSIIAIVWWPLGIVGAILAYLLWRNTIKEKILEIVQES